MDRIDIVWDPSPNGNIEHIANHDLLPEDIEEVIWNPIGHDTSRSTGRPIVYGFTPDGRYILVVYEELDSKTVYPITAYEIEL